jgi:5-methylcytosine-specific restriction endonuclease McrA
MSDRRLIKEVEAFREASKVLKLDHCRCLVLNSDFSPLSSLPISAVPWQDAVVGVIQNKLQVLEAYDERVIRTPSTTFVVPSVVVTTKFSQQKKRKVLFSKANVFMRDNYQCQYCDRFFTGSELTFDHVIPRSKGGKTSWTNIVSACDGCNTKKGSKTIAEWVRAGTSPCGYRGPLHAPVQPNYYAIMEKARRKPVIIPEGSKWEQYMQWEGPIYIRNERGATYPITGDNPEPIGVEELGY